MDKAVVWSLRLGFSGRQQQAIAKLGINRFLEASYAAKIDKELPDCLRDVPKTVDELKAFRADMKSLSEAEQKEIRRASRRRGETLQDWWLEKMRFDKYPLREKMVLFWQNHFVAAAKKVKVNHWLYVHNQTLRENAFGNFRELTRMTIKTNAVIKYLDNDDNKAGRINENLSRELLELFTLGVGNYSEADIKNGARALAGLGLGSYGKGQYRKHREDNEAKSYLGKTGNLKVDDLIDQIFQQPAAPYLITRKILQWFITDLPSEKMIKRYGDYLRKMDFEIKPLLNKICNDEFAKENYGLKIKDPLVYSIHLLDELRAEGISNVQIARFTRDQGMELYNPPNVKGWPGGRSWLTAQIFLQRNKVVDLLCANHPLRKLSKKYPKPAEVIVNLDWNKKGSAKKIIEELADRLLFQVDPELQDNMEQLLKYDFEPEAEHAEQTVLRLFNFITKQPAFQLV